MNRIQRLIDRTTKRVDQPDLLGQDAVYKTVVYGDVDASTGLQSSTETSIPVKIRAWPIMTRDRMALAQAGLRQVDARWSLRAAYIETVNPGDRIEVSGFTYEVQDEPSAVLDEFGIDWIIYTRRMR
jgi:hypothetical protein